MGKYLAGAFQAILHAFILWLGGIAIFAVYGFNPGESAAKDRGWEIAFPLWVLGSLSLMAAAAYYRLKRKDKRTYWWVTAAAFIWPIALIIAVDLIV